MHGRFIKPGQIFMAYPSEIPKSFRDLVLALSGDGKWEQTKKEEESPPAPVKVTKPLYTIQPRGKSALWFDIVDAQGKVINEKGLKKEVAEKFIEDLLK